MREYKKFIFLVLLPAIFGGVVGHSLIKIGEGALRSETPKAADLERIRGARVITDPATGCQYLAPQGHGGITPRLDRNGRQLCEGVGDE